MANNNVFLNAYNGMARRGGGGGGFTGMLADARRMQFEVGMAQMQHQMGLERDAIQHAYNKDMAKTQGKQQRKTLKAQNAANMERDTHLSGLKIEEATAMVGPYMDRVLGGITDSMGTPGAVGTFNQQSSSASRSTLPRYGGGGGGDLADLAPPSGPAIELPPPGGDLADLAPPSGPAIELPPPGSSKMPRKMRQKVQGKGLNPPK